MRRRRNGWQRSHKSALFERSDLDSPVLDSIKVQITSCNHLHAEKRSPFIFKDEYKLPIPKPVDFCLEQTGARNGPISQNVSSFFAKD